MGRVQPPEKLSAESQSLYDAMNGASPLACVLIGGAFLEKSVTSLLLKFFVQCETAKGVLTENGFLGEFSRCSDVAYCLGLIPKGAFTNLKTIGKIRNMFAHSTQALDFDDKGVRANCDNLVLPPAGNVVREDGKKDLFEEMQDKSQARLRFTFATVTLFNHIILCALGTESRLRAVHSLWPDPPKAKTS